MPFHRRHSRRTTCTGVSANSGSSRRAKAEWAPFVSRRVANHFRFVIDVIGVLSNPTPLATLLPGAGIPGCTLVPATHFLEVRTVGNGRAESTFAIPDLVGLAGFPFFHQMIPFEFDGSLNLIGVTGTDTLQLTIGEF